MRQYETEKELKQLKETLIKLKNEGKILIAIVYGSFAHGQPHKRSDIDLALVINAEEAEKISIIDKILLSTDRSINILFLDDYDESPFIVQEALKGVHLVEPDYDLLHEIARRALYEAEEIRFRRSLKI